MSDLVVLDRGEEVGCFGWVELLAGGLLVDDSVDGVEVVLLVAAGFLLEAQLDVLLGCFHMNNNDGASIDVGINPIIPKGVQINDKVVPKP